MRKEFAEFLHGEMSYNENIVLKNRMSFTEDQLLKDITECISKLNLNIASIDMKGNEGIATCILVLEVRDKRQLDRLSSQIKKVKNYISMERI